MSFKICRYNPDTDVAPYMRDIGLGIEAGDKMLLDAILSFSSCRQYRVVRR